MASAVFNFDQQKTFAQSIEVEDLGNCALRCSDKYMNEYYVVTQTLAGKTYILKFGPIIPDLEYLSSDFFLSYKKINYKEEMIEKEVLTLLNDAKKKITKAEKIELSEALALIPGPDRFVPGE